MASQHLLTPVESELLIRILKSRFEADQNRHQELKWSEVEERLNQYPEKLWSLNEM